VTGFVPRSASPLLKARELAWLRFARRDLEKAVCYYTSDEARQVLGRFTVPFAIR